MLTLKECRKLVDPKGEKYTDEELMAKLEFITQLAEIVVNDIKENENEKAGSPYVTGIK